MKYNQDYHSSALIMLATTKDISNGVITNFKFSPSDPVPEGISVESLSDGGADAPQVNTTDEQQNQPTQDTTNQNTIQTTGFNSYQI